MKITSKLLKEWDACPLGREWFRKIYPSGLIITKENLLEFVKALSRRKKGFESRKQFLRNNKRKDMVYNLEWLLQHIIEKIQEKKKTSITDVYNLSYRTESGHDHWDQLTNDQMAGYFWKDYKKHINYQRLLKKASSRVVPRWDSSLPGDFK